MLLLLLLLLPLLLQKMMCCALKPAGQQLSMDFWAMRLTRLHSHQHVNNPVTQPAVRPLLYVIHHPQAKPTIVNSQLRRLIVSSTVQHQVDMNVHSHHHAEDSSAGLTVISLQPSTGCLPVVRCPVLGV
jgi:hypothetical protein